LIVYPDAVLTPAISSQDFESIAGKSREVSEILGGL
jgi:hypothetical protein